MDPLTITDRGLCNVCDGNEVYTASVVQHSYAADSSLIALSRMNQLLVNTAVTL